MNGFLLAASALAAVVGLVHTMLGERLILAAAMFGASVLVFVATRARHPGWVGLLLVALLAVMGSRG